VLVGCARSAAPAGHRQVRGELKTHALHARKEGVPRLRNTAGSERLISNLTKIHADHGAEQQLQTLWQAWRESLSTVVSTASPLAGIEQRQISRDAAALLNLAGKLA